MPDSGARINVSIDRSKHTVLVVDDNPVTCYATARSLRAAGFKTIEAGTGQEALDLSIGNVSAVVLDVHLPDIGGFEVCRMIREREVTTSIPIVHLSAAFIGEADKVAGLNAGADAYLVHPAEPAMLIATVQALVRARMAEDHVHRSEAKFRTIYAQAQSGIALIDAEGRFQDANPAMLEMLGRGAGEVIGRRISDFAAPEFQPLVRARTTSGVDAKTLWREEFVLLNAAGSAVHVEWSMSPSVENELRVAAVSNVSDRIQLEIERKSVLEREQAARANAERYSRSKDDFVAVLSHELRNPLSAIMMNVHQLLRKEPPPEFARSLDAIKRNASTQARIISDILDVSRINSGKLTLEREWVDPAALVASSLDSMRSFADKKPVEMVLQIETHGAVAFLDAARFQQIFWNILNNAVKFSNPGGTVHVMLSVLDGRLTLRIRDQGKGIDRDFLGRIFEKFTQSDAPGSRPSGGLGLGMSIVKHLVELHAGVVEVESAGIGAGTTVSVSIPLSGPLPESMAPSELPLESAPAPLEISIANVLSGLRILVVEDDREAADILVLILEDRGARVSWAGDYDTALRLLESRPDVLVSDIGLPGKDGYDLMREIRRREGAAARLPAIALTAFGRDTDKAVALEAGFDIHLAKPLAPQKLLNAIERVVGQAPRR